MHPSARPLDTLATRRSLLALGLVVTAAVPIFGWLKTGPTAESPVSTTVHLPDWGVASIEQIRSGQVGLIHDTEALRLEVYHLRDSPRPEFPRRVLSRTPALTDNSFVVADFDAGVRNELSGYFNAFERSPSRARVTLAAAPDGRRGLRLSYERAEGGFCGVWVHFFDLGRPPHERIYLDARPLSTLSFWVRGGQGGERVLVKLADEEWERIGDALSLGELGDFLSSGRVETGWQQAVVPLDDLPERIDRSRLASLVLEGMAPEEGEVFVSRLALSKEPEPLPPLVNPSPPTAAVEANPAATWIWNTAELLDRPGRQDSLADYLALQGLTAAFVQLVSIPGARLPVGEIDPDPRMRRLVAVLHRSGIRVYALDGSKEYALPEHHAAVLATIRNVAGYNEQATATERFDGVRYDIEPYLLPGFHGPRRDDLLAGYLEILQRGADLAREADLLFGADIPFWYDAPNEITFERVSADFRGNRKPVSEHIIDLADDVSIMAYRTTAFGADGIIRHAVDELAYAERLGKPVFVGLETEVLPDETLIDFRGEPAIGLTELGTDVEHVGMVADRDSVRVVFLPALREVPESRSEVIADQLARLGMDASLVAWWTVTRRTSVPGDKISFAPHGAESLQQAMRESGREFARHSSFAGFAIHHSESYLQLSRQ